MPKRGEEIKQGSQTRNKIEILTTLAGQHLNFGNDIKKLTTAQDKGKKEIKALMEDPEIYTKNGKHKEVTLPAGDGKTEYFVQVQVAESVSTVDNVIALLRGKLKEKAETYITTVEVLHPNALESAYNQGLITEMDILDWTTTKETERLIVKVKEDAV